jgi:hypothetical protein
MVNFLQLMIGTYFIFGAMGLGLFPWLTVGTTLQARSAATLMPILGAVSYISIASLCASRGANIETTATLALGVSSVSGIFWIAVYRPKLALRKIFSVFYESRGTTKKIKFLALARSPLTLILFFASFMDLLIRGPLKAGYFWGARLGIDAALYVDGAQALISNENRGGLNNINVMHPAGLASALFGSSHRWGTSFVGSLIGKFLNHGVSVESFLPSLTLLMVLSSIFTAECFYKKSNFSTTLLSFGFLCLNSLYLVLLLEAQWANCLAVVFFSTLLCLSLMEFSVFEINHLKKFFIRLAIYSIFVLSFVFTYTEVIPLIVLYMFIFLGIYFLFFYKNLISSLKVIGFVTIYMVVILVLVTLINVSYGKYLISLFHLNGAAVGYNQPYPTYPTDIFGLTSVWFPSSNWMVPAESVHFVSNTRTSSIILLSIILVFLLLRNAINIVTNLVRVNRSGSSKLIKKSILIKQDPLLRAMSVAYLASVVMLIACYSYFGFLKRSNYMLTKALVLDLIPLVTTSIYFLIRYKFRSQNFYNMCVGVVIFVVGLTSFRYSDDFANSSHKIGVSFPKLASWDMETPKDRCIVLGGARDAGDPAARYFNRTYDYLLYATLRNHVVVDPWTLAPIAGIAPIDLNNIDLCLILDAKYLEATNQRIDQTNRLILFSSGEYSVLDLKATIGEVTKFMSLDTWENQGFPRLTKIKD